MIAGCQAEDFLVNGLKDGQRVLLELRGMGHDLSVSNLYGGMLPSMWSKRFVGLLEDFIKMSSNVAKFRSDSRVHAELERLKATERTREDRGLLGNDAELNGFAFALAMDDFCGGGQVGGGLAVNGGDEEAGLHVARIPARRGQV